MHTYVMFDASGLVEGIAHAWLFDDAYAQVALDGLDKNGDGQYSAEELRELTVQNMKSLKDYDYFTSPRVDGKPVSIGEVRNAAQVYTDNRLALLFKVPLAQKVDPRRAQFSYKVYDPEYFIDFSYPDEKSAGALGDIPNGCSINLIAASSDEQTEQIKKLLAEKGRGWKPPPDEDFGGMFAQPVLVVCTS